MIHWEMLSVFILVVVAVSLLAFRAAHWKSGDLHRLQEWGLAGRRFGALTSWFLLGGDVYTAYSFVAVPGLVFASGAPAFFVLPYLILAFPLAFLVLPRFWSIARHRGYITSADFVRERFGSRSLALAIAVTSLLATLPYIALQIYGIEVSIAQMGVPIEISLIIAFVILAAYTYTSGLRAPALMSIVKDLCIWLVVLVAVISIPLKLGGFGHIFALVQMKAQQHPTTFHFFLQGQDYSVYVSLAIGSALALFLYPHTLTGVLSTNSRKALQRTLVFLPAYTLLIGIIALFGYFAIAAGIQSSAPYHADGILPMLFATMFPGWFAGFAFATITIGALVPAAIMSIATANLFTRNIYREYFRPSCSEYEEANVAKAASLVVKLGALAFVLYFPTNFAINLQLIGGILIVQTLPSVVLGLYTNWFHRSALLLGLGVGLASSVWLAVQQKSLTIATFSFAGMHISLYSALVTLAANLLVCVLLTLALRLLHIPGGKDVTSAADFATHPMPALPAHVFYAQMQKDEVIAD